MADIFEIVGKFAIEGADKAQREINGVADAGEKSSSKLNKFGKVMGGVGKGVLAVAGAVSAGGVALVKSVQSSYGELQQNLGGSEAVFGQYAKNIQETAKDAYKNMGMSQAEYLATANKMGSLFQGSGIAQKEALDMTTKAMQRASDVASVMGIDMSMAMESIAGAAKGNFTMMDNLGVAMNATTLEAYALSKGMTDFSWKSASSAEKNALAMQMFLERTEQYAGNFARESTDTISGAIGYLGASWQNFIAGLGNPMADMAQLTNQLAQSFGAMINNIVPIVENIANALPTVLPSIVNAISGLAPTLIKTFTDVITKMINSIIPLLPTVIPLFVDMLVKVGMALAQNAPILIDGFIQLITQLTVAIAENLPTLIPIFIDCMVQIAGAIVKNAPIILDAILSIGGNFENGLSPAINACIGLVEVLTGAFIAFKAGAIIQGVVQGFQSAQVALSLFKLETQGASIAQGLLNGQLTIGQTVVGLLTGQVTLAEIATGLWSKAQVVLNAVMSANPIALVVMAIGALIAIIAVVIKKLADEKEAIKSVQQAQEDLTKAKEDAMSAENSYINALERSEDALKKLQDAEKALGMSGEELFNQVQNGTLDFQNMTEEQRNCYKAYLDNEEAQKTLTESTKALNEARKAETIASFENQLALAVESGKYDEFKNSVVDAYNNGRLSAEEARDLIGKSMSEMSTTSQQTFMNDLPNDIKNGLDPAHYQTKLQQMKSHFTGAYDSIKEKFAPISEFFKGVWDGIKEVFAPAVDWFKTKFTQAKEKVTSSWKDIKSKFNEKWEQIKSVFEPVIDWFKTKFNNAKNAVLTPWNNIKSKFAPIWNNIKSAFKTNDFRSIGKNLVTGLWNGITSSYKWLTGKLKEWCGNVVNAIKGLFGIHSPSRVTRDEIGKPLVDGVAVGIKENSGEVSKEFQNMLDELQLQRDLGIIDEAEYYSKLEVLRDNHLEKGTKDWWQYTKEIINYETQAYEDINSAYEEHLKNRGDMTSDFFGKLTNKTLYSKVDIKDGEDTTSLYSLRNWEEDVSFLDSFGQKIDGVQDRLKTMFGDDEVIQSIIDTFRNDPFGEEGGILLDLLSRASDEELTKYVSGYREFMSKATSVTNNIYADDLTKFDNDFIKGISEKFKNSPLLTQLKDMGANLIENLMLGIDSKDGWLKTQIIGFCESLSQTFNDGLNVGFSKNLQLAGVDIISSVRQTDYTTHLNNLNDSIDTLTSLIGGQLPGISQKLDRPIVIDGNSLAVGMSRRLDSELGKVSVAKDRGNV